MDYPKAFLLVWGSNKDVRPTLFNIFIDDLVLLCDQVVNDSPDLDGTLVSCLLYADDLVLISKSKTGLQNLLNGLNYYCSKWFMKPNFKKTKCLIFGKRRTMNETFLLGTSTVDNCDSYVFLGTIFNWNGSFKSAMTYLSKKALCASFRLTNKIASFKSCSFPILLKLFIFLF